MVALKDGKISFKEEEQANGKRRWTILGVRKDWR